MGATGTRWTDKQKAEFGAKMRATWTPERRQEMSDRMRGNKYRSREATSSAEVAAPPPKRFQVGKTAESVQHGTQAELQFITGLGMWCGKFSRASLLRQYLAAMDRRDDWGGIDGAAVGTHVASEIEKAAA